MDTNENEAELSLDVYQYRNEVERQNKFIHPAAVGRSSPKSSNISLDEGKEKWPKTYAILQEQRSGFSNRKLRYALLIYSNPGWEIFILSVLFISYILDTCLYTFCRRLENSFWIVMLLFSLNIMFTLDVIILFGLKFFKKWRKTLNLVEPDMYRVILDMILAMPYSLLYFIDPRESLFDSYTISPIVSAIRVYRIIEYFYNRSSQAGSNQWTTFLVQYLILFVLSVHTWTCIWYLFAYKNFDLHKYRSSWSVTATHLPTETKNDWYFICAYWSVMFLTTNALGDLYPITTPERISAITAILLGFLLTTVVFVGSLTSQFITITSRRARYVRQLKKIQSHLKLIKMDKATTKRIIRYYEDLWYQKSGVFKPKLLRLLPFPLQTEICYDLNAVPLYSSLIFRKLPEAFLRRLSVTMSHRFYLPGDIIYNHNQNKTDMICVTNGVLELLSDEDDESPMISFSKGTCFGEIALILNIPARCTVKAATYVECQILKKTDFTKLMITYPNLVAQIRKDIQERIDRSRLRKTKQTSNDQLLLNIYVSKERKKSSIKCLKDKLRYRQGITDVDLTKDNELDENCLDLYILSEHIKKSKLNFTCINSNFPWILESDCYLAKYWELYMLCIVIYICILYPYFIGIKRGFPGGFFFYAEIVFAISLTINIIMSLVTAVKTRKKYIKNFSDILKYRLNSPAFYLDIFALIPFEYIVTIHTTRMYYDDYREHLFYLCKGTKLCLVWRLASFFEQWERKLLSNTIIIKIAKYCTYVSLLCYWCGVVLYMESCFVARCSQNSWFARALTMNNQKNDVIQSSVTKTKFPLITSIYFATTLLLSVGYGDFIPGDKCDMGLVAFLSLYGVLLTGYCISEFSSVVTHWSRTKTAFLEVIITIDKFMKENNMSQAIKYRIMAFYELQWQYNSGVELTDESWLDTTVVPTELRKKVLHQARFKALTSIKFFQVKNKAYIQTLTEMARDIILPPGEIVYYGGTISRELYIIERGYCLVTSKTLKDGKKERVIGPGNHLGLLVMLYGVPAVNTVVTLTHCKLISISHFAYTSALNLFPDMREHEDLLTSDELKIIEDHARLHTANSYFQLYNFFKKNQKTKITNILQDFLDGKKELLRDKEMKLQLVYLKLRTLVILHMRVLLEFELRTRDEVGKYSYLLSPDSFINVYKEYKKRNESYLKSFDQFAILNKVAPYMLMPIAITPDGVFLKTWALIRISSAFIMCLLIPIVVSIAPLYGSYNIILLLFESIAYIDLYLMLHVAFYGNKNQLIYHPYLTAKKYVTNGFIADFLTCFPWYALWQIFVRKHNESHSQEEHYLNSHLYHCMLRMINVLQIHKLYAAFWTESIGALKRAYLMSVVQFILLTIFFLNLYTSILIIMSCTYVIASNRSEFERRIGVLSRNGPLMDAVYNPEGNMICRLGSWLDEAKTFKIKNITPTKAYLLAYYWSATSFSGAGFGDILAQDTTHMILSICINVHGVLFFGYVYARMASLKAMADQMITKFQENLKHLELFLNSEKVALLLKRSIIDYWKYQWKRTGGWSHQTILGKLHSNLNEDAVLFMYEKTLREIPLFENVEYSFFRAFAKQLKENYFQKGYMVIRSNEVISNMYIIYRGKVDIISDSNEVEACMGPGGIFGNIRGASRYRTRSNIVASRNIDLLSIEGPEFYAILKSYPSVLKKVKQSFDSTSADYVIPTVMSEEISLVQPFSLTYESGADEDDVPDINTNVDSPEKSIASHGSRSVTSAGNDEFIAAKYLLFIPHRWFRSSVVPDSKFVIFMDYLVMFLSYVDFMILVYQMAFLSNVYFFYICTAFDAIFIYKVFLDLHTGYTNRYGDCILNPKKVRKMYFSKVFLRRRDFMSILPISYIAFAMNLNPKLINAIFCYLRTPQLFRITYLFTYRQHSNISIGTANLFLKLNTIAIWASILTHVNACLFFKLSCLTPVHCTSANWMSKEELSLRAQYAEGQYFSLYVASLWYMMNLLTITGTGDVSSQNDFEVIETIIIIIIIKFCTGLLISEMSAMITAHSSSRIAYDYRINELRDGLRDTDLSEHQTNKMWDYVCELWNRQQGRQMPKLVYKLPFRLRSQVMQDVYGCHIGESIIFSKTEDDFKRMLVMWMRHCVFFPGNYIVQRGDSDQCIYFIHRGEVEVLTVHQNLTESIYDVLGPEDCFGLAQGLFVGVQHYFSFRARTVVDIVYLKLDEWKYLLDFYPKSAKLVRKKVENVYLAI